MVLNIPGLFERNKIFKESPEDGQVDIYEGGRTVPENINVIQTVTGTTIDSTTSSEWVDIDEMSITVNRNGTYIIIFSANILSLVNSGIPKLTRIQILNGETALTAAEVGSYNNNVAGAAGIQMPISMITVNNLVAGDVIKVQWKNEYTGTTWNMDNGSVFRTLTILPIRI